MVFNNSHPLLGSIVPNINIYQKYAEFRKENDVTELGEKELKDEIIKECINAGWSIKNKYINLTSLPKPMQKTLTELGFKKGIRCFEGISIAEEPICESVVEKYFKDENSIEPLKNEVT